MGSIKLVKNDDLVVKSNALIESSYKLGINEQKMIRYIASKIKKDDSEFKTYRFKVTDFADAIGVKGNGYYDELKKLSLEILSKPVQMKIDGRWVGANWFSYISYLEQDGIMEVRFDAFFKPHFLSLQEKFTRYSFDQIALLKSTYSVRLFELCKQYESIGNRTIQLEELRKMLGIDKNQYKEYSNFKLRVLLYSQKEINEKTLLSYEFEEIKERRKVVSIKFIIKNKGKLFNPIEVEDTEDKSDSEQMDLFSEDLEKGLPSAEALKIREILNQLRIDEEAKVIEQWIEEYGEIGVLNAIKILKSKTDIDDKVKYLKGIMYNQKNMSPKTAKISKNKTDSALDKAIDKVKKQFEKNTGPIPEFFAGGKAQAIFQNELGIVFDEAEALWGKHKEEIMDYISQQIKVNRKNK